MRALLARSLEEVGLLNAEVGQLRSGLHIRLSLLAVSLAKEEAVGASAAVAVADAEAPEGSTRVPWPQMLANGKAALLRAEIARLNEILIDARSLRTIEPVT